MADQQIHVALAGNPNAGKTTLFNLITGSNGYVGNWPGVTVEKKEAKLISDKNVTITDLPGIYSLSPYSPEEQCSRDYLMSGEPDVVIQVIDATNLERNLYLGLQVVETGLPVVFALNMADQVEKNGDKIDVEKLSKQLGSPVLMISALKNQGVDELIAQVKKSAAMKHKVPEHRFDSAIEDVLDHIESLVPASVPAEKRRYYAVKLFERDEAATKVFDLPKADAERVEALIAKCEKDCDDDAESIITGERYNVIAHIMDECVKKAPAKMSTSEKIDRVVTNRILGLPIFIVIMFAVYYIAVSTVGTVATDWANDGVFGDGWFLFGIGADTYQAADDDWASHDYPDQISGYISAVADAADKAGVKVDADAVQAAADDYTGDQENADEDQKVLQEFEQTVQSTPALASLSVKDIPFHDADGNFLSSEGDNEPLDEQGYGDDAKPVVNGQAVDPETSDGVKKTDPVDLAAFKKALETPEPDPAETQGGIWVPGVPVIVGDWLTAANASPAVQSLVLDGAVAGLGAILGFIPQMFILFVMLAFLEDCGYMARVAFIMDRVFRRFGLSGKSFIPMLISSGCGVPGVMSTKTIENEKDRRMTIMTTTFVPCGAKLPIIALLMGAILADTGAWWISPLFYFLGVFAVIVSGIMLKKTKLFAGRPTPFVMELPSYHLPALGSWWLHVWERVASFFKKAGTVIFGATVLVWFLSSFGIPGWQGADVSGFTYLPGVANVPDDGGIEYSMLAGFGNAIAWIFTPLGFDNWKAAAMTVTGLIAKENVVATAGTLLSLDGATENSAGLWNAFRDMFLGNGGTIGACVAFGAFNLLCAPCFAAMGTIKRQMDSPKWTAIAIGYECAFAWCVGTMINQFYLLSQGVFSGWTILAFVILAAMLFQLFRPMPHNAFDDEEREGEGAKAAA